MEDAIPQGVPAGGQQTGHEDTTISVRGLVIAAFGLVATVVVCQLVLAWWLRGFKAEENKAEMLHPGRQEIDVVQFPQPRLQESPPVELVQMVREEKARIASYGWVDPKAGIARIPVDRAMEILAEKGLPRVAAPPPTAGRRRTRPSPRPGSARRPGRPRTSLRLRRKRISRGPNRSKAGSHETTYPAADSGLRRSPHPVPLPGGARATG